MNTVSRMAVGFDLFKAVQFRLRAAGVEIEHVRIVMLRIIGLQHLSQIAEPSGMTTEETRIRLP